MTAMLFECDGPGTKVRLSFVKTSQSSSGYGQKGESDMPIEDGTVYQDAFKKIQQGIFVRTNVN